MKILTTFLLFAYCSLVWSFPKVGDFVRFEAHFQGDHFKIEKKVLAYDQDKDLFKVRTLTLVNNEISQDQSHDLPRNFLYTREKVENVFKTCVSREGALGQMRIEDKTIKVCEFYNEDSQLSYMIGEVPFGQVKFQIYLKDEDFLDFNLTRFVHGE